MLADRVLGGFGGMVVSWLRKLRERTEATVSQLSSTRNPRQEMDAVVDQLGQQVAEVQTQLAGYVATAHEFRQRWEDRAALAEKRGDEALAALQSGQDELARRALADQARLEVQAKESQQMWRQAEDTLQRLRAQLDELQLEQLRLQQQRDELVTRANTAELERQVADLKSGLDSRARSFEKMEDDVQHLEVQAQAHREVANWQSTAKVEDVAEVDARFEALRRQLEQGS